MTTEGRLPIALKCWQRRRRCGCGWSPLWSCNDIDSNCHTANGGQRGKKKKMEKKKFGALGQADSHHVPQHAMKANRIFKQNFSEPFNMYCIECTHMYSMEINRKWHISYREIHININLFGSSFGRHQAATANWNLILIVIQTLTHFEWVILPAYKSNANHVCIYCQALCTLVNLQMIHLQPLIRSDTRASHTQCHLPHIPAIYSQY